MAGVKFELKYDDAIKIQERIKTYGPEAEKVLNDYLHGEGGRLMIDSITNLIPISEKGKRHAQMNKWFHQENYNLSVNITTSGPFWYLFFPITGQGTSKGYGERDFFTEGVDKVYDRVVGDMLDRLSKKFEEVM